MQEILQAVPGDEGLIRSIIQGMIEGNLIRSVDAGETYEPSPHGRQVKDSLDQIPEDVKKEAYQQAWGSPPPDGY